MPRKHIAVTHEPRECPACHEWFTPVRSDQRVCSAACRQRKKRGTYVVTAADRAAIRKVLEGPLPGLPDVPPTAEQVQAHVLALTARTKEPSQEASIASVAQRVRRVEVFRTVQRELRGASQAEVFAEAERRLIAAESPLHPGG